MVMEGWEPGLLTPSATFCFSCFECLRGGTCALSISQSLPLFYWWLQIWGEVGGDWAVKIG